MLPQMLDVFPLAHLPSGSHAACCGGGGHTFGKVRGELWGSCVPAMT